MLLWMFFIIIINILLPINIAFSQQQETPNYLQKLEAVTLANKILEFGKTYDLQYRDYADLLETCQLIIAHENVSRIYNRWDVAAIIARESRFKRKALSRHGAKGLTQTMDVWKKEFPWYTNPYNKSQNIRACYMILDKYHDKYGSKRAVLRKYNGTWAYADTVLSIKRKIRG